MRLPITSHCVAAAVLAVSASLAGATSAEARSSVTSSFGDTNVEGSGSSDRITLTADGSQIRISDPAGVTESGDCVRSNPTLVVCKGFFDAGVTYGVRNVTGGAGIDTISFGRGGGLMDGVIDGGAGDDTIFGSGIVMGGGGNDIIEGSSRDDSIVGGTGNDTIRSLGGRDRVIDERGKDKINSGSGADEVIATAVGRGRDRGRDRINCGSPGALAPGRGDGRSGSQDVVSADGIDRVRGCEVGRLEALGAYLRGYTPIFGSLGADFIVGSPSPDRLYGKSGGDRIFGRGGRDRLYGGPGSDRLYGGRGKDLIYGQRGNDRINSRDRSRDLVFCGPGRRDRARIDRRDRVFACERVSKR